MLPPWMIPGDLARGDKKCLASDWSAFQLTRITSPNDSAFLEAYEILWNEFGAAGEIESPSVLAERLAWDPKKLISGHAFLYELQMITHQGSPVGVRDHTAIVNPTEHSAIVHLSHNLVVPAWRRSGLAGWLRALPIQTARTCLAAQSLSPNSRITLVGEMEPLSPSNPSRLTRLIAYEKAGYKKVDPSKINYLQPDFRTPSKIDSTGGPQPLALSLILRIVNEEDATTLSGACLRHIVNCLYQMYARSFRTADMAVLFDHLDHYPQDTASIPLIPPTA